MITAHQWPAAIIPLPKIEYAGEPVLTAITSGDESGFISRRRRFSLAYNRVRVRWLLTPAQYQSFRIFFVGDLYNGTAAFDLEVRFPKNSVLTLWQVKFLGKYRANYSDGHWDVQADLILLHPVVEHVVGSTPVIVEPVVIGGGGGGGSPTYNPDNPGGPVTPLVCSGGGSNASMISNYVWFMGQDVNPNDVLGSAIAIHQELFANELPGLLAGATVHSVGAEVYWYWSNSSGSYKSAYFKTGYPSTDPTSPDGDVYISTSGGGWWALAKDYCIS